MFDHGVYSSGTPANQGGLQIRMFHSRLFETNSGLFISGSQALLVDPGIFPDEIQEILAVAAGQQLSLQAVLLTHSHWDHILGPERIPGTPVITQAAFQKTTAAQKETILGEINAWEAAHRIPRARPFRLPGPDLTFEKDMEFFLGEECLRFLAGPGHAPDQCVVYHPSSGSLWAADMLSDLEIPFISSSLSDYQRTLAMLARLEIQSLIPGHGQPTDDRKEIKARLSGDQAYLEQLAEKVAQAVALQKSMQETVGSCAKIHYRQKADNAGPHRMNVESAYLELGGDPAGQAQAGWSQVG
jgi:hydroxyacylglutathione hydrolase